MFSIDGRKSLSGSAIFLLAMMVSACGGGGGGGGSTASVAPMPAPTPPPTSNQGAAGLWNATSQVTSGPNAGDTVKSTVLVASTGQFYFLSANLTNHCAAVGFGNEAVSGSSVTGATVEAVVTYAPGTTINTTCSFPDGSTSATGNITGTVTPASSLVISDTGTTALGTSLPAGPPVTYTYDALYNQGASTASVTGTYLTTSGGVLSISSAGLLSLSNPVTGCQTSGNVSIPNSSYNAYQLALSVSGCTGASVNLNGAVLSGLAYLDTSSAPTKLTFGVSGLVSGQTFVLVDSVPKQ